MIYNGIEMSNYESSPKTINLKYILQGSRSQISYTVYGEMSDFLSKQPRYIMYPMFKKPPTDIDFIMKFLNEERQRYFINPLVKKIQNTALIKDNQARIAISIVQNIAYDSEGIKNRTIKGKYPYEVLYTGSGVCSEKAQLLAYLLRELGYETVIFKFDI